MKHWEDFRLLSDACKCKAPHTSATHELSCKQLEIVSHRCGWPTINVPERGFKFRGFSHRRPWCKTAEGIMHLPLGLPAPARACLHVYFEVYDNYRP
jgi:hypothetical protein